MPAAFQGVTVNASGTPILDLKNARGMSQKEQRTMLDALNKYNGRHPVIARTTPTCLLASPATSSPIKCR